MFIKFMYALRDAGLKVSTDQWLLLMEALDKGMAENSLVGFYFLARNVLVKKESDYDKFDAGFMSYFKGIKTISDLPPELMEWLSHDELERSLDDMPDDLEKHDLDELMKMFEERLAEQTEKHDGGNYWIGTGGTSTMGHGGYNPQGIRVGGESRHMSAVKIAGERKFRDFRQDTELNIRQFQMAFRKLRQFSSRIDSAKTELDVEGTIKATGDNAGLLKLVYEKPRKNTVKLLLLIDSDGSMWKHTELINQLFQALHQSTHLKDLQTFYFHNCIYEKLYTTPLCRYGDWVDTDWVLGNFGSEYKVIIVGDASMSSYELMYPGGNINWYNYNEDPGIDWLRRMRRQYEKSIWLNPITADRWDYVRGRFTIAEIRKVFPMFELTLDGLDQGIKKLL